MRLLLTILMLGLGLTALAKATKKGKPLANLCDSGDEVFFNCSTGKKTISVCSSKGWAADKGFLQYRFGQPGKVELTIPKDKTTLPKNVASYHQLMYSGGGGAAVRFAGGDFDYVVYSGIGKGWEKAGVSVEKSGNQSANVLCKGEADIDLAALEKSGLKVSSVDFEIP